MRRLLFVIILQIACSCASTKGSIVETGVYESKPVHMMGSIKLILADTTFVLSERDGMMYTDGIWRMSNDESKIYLSSRNKGSSKRDTAIYFVLREEAVVVKSKHRLIYRNVLLTKDSE